MGAYLVGGTVGERVPSGGSGLATDAASFLFLEQKKPYYFLVF